SSQTVVQPTDLRALKEEHVAIARERVFGPQGNMPGDRQFRKKLEGRQLMRWYFPSKYNLQDFGTEDYFEMQAERFAPREVHRSIPQLTQTLEKVSRRREELRAFFSGMDEATFLDSPTLQDLYGLFRLIDGDRALSFDPPEQVFLEHSPFCGPSPLLRVSSRAAPSSPSSGAPGAERDPAEEHQLQAEPELGALLSALKNKLGKEGASALEARITRQRSLEDVRNLLLEEANKHNVLVPLDVCTVVFETIRTAKAGADARPTEDLSNSETTSGAAEQQPKAQPDVLPGERLRLARYAAKQELGGSKEDRAKQMAKAESELERLKTKGPLPIRTYLARRHRFVDPMFRRRRLKWLERQMAGLNKDKEVKYNQYYATHPDKTPEWPTNKGSVTIKWPSPHH
ncbi:unnamed protein product, partial [Polarella glacialis]